MNCTNLNTAAEILEAFRACNNPGEEIELFECLATRPDPKPPVGAFLDILSSIKLEAVLALTIQAFGKITDADIKVLLKESQGLLTILSQQAQSGSNDLIRWSAATTIDNLGLDFITVSQYLTEEPKEIAEKIVQSKVKRFADRNLENSNDYDEFLKFWIYGDHKKLREITINYDFWILREEWESKRKMVWQDSRTQDQVERLNKFTICWEVMERLELSGLKDANIALERAEAMGENALPVDQNQVFEGIASTISSQKIYEHIEKKISGSIIEEKLVWVKILIHCLQSNNKRTRYFAATILKNINNVFSYSPTIDMVISTFVCEEEKSLSYPYKELKILENNLLNIAQRLTRVEAHCYCKLWSIKLSEKIRIREGYHQRLNNSFNQVKSINKKLYEQVFSKVDFKLLQWALDNNEAEIGECFKKIHPEINKFYNKEINFFNKNTLEEQKKQIYGLFYKSW